MSDHGRSTNGGPATSACPYGNSQAIDLQQLWFLSERALPMADYLHPCHRRLLLTNLKFIIYENDKHHPASGSSNDLVRPVLTTNINGAG
jgi:hypothetical protein